MSDTIFGAVSLIHRLIPTVTTEELVALAKEIENTPYGETMFEFRVGSQETDALWFQRIVQRHEDGNHSGWATPLDQERAEYEYSGWDWGQRDFFSIDPISRFPRDMGSSETFLTNVESILETIGTIYFRHTKDLEYSWTMDKLLIVSEIPLLSILYHSGHSNQIEVACFYIIPANVNIYGKVIQRRILAP